MPLRADKPRGRAEAVAREMSVVEDLESRIRSIKDPYNCCQRDIEPHRK